MTNPTWVAFTDVDQLRPGRRMRAHEGDTEVLTVANIRLLTRGRPNILFTNGAGLDMAVARDGWQIEV